MLNTNHLVRSLAAVGLLVAASASQATITVHTSLATFNTAVQNPGTDTYAGFSLDGQTFGPLNRTAGSYGYVATTEPNNAFYGAGSTANPWLSTNTAQDAIFFGGFTGGVAALGANVFATNISGAFTTGDIIFTATDADGTVSRTITGASLNSFLGFVSSTGSLSSAFLISVQPVGGGFIWPTVDNLVLGAAAAVPEPATYTLLVAGVGIVGFMARRRRAN
jgi:hypothetical protein